MDIMFSKLNRHDLKDILKYLDNFLLSYRYNLGLPEYLTFGIELEYDKLENAKDSFFISEIMQNWQTNPDWETKKEPSIPLGREISSRILHDDYSSWHEVKTVCEFLKDSKVKPINDMAGGHIHIGVNILEDNYIYLRKFLKLYTIFEYILYRFGYGDKLNGRPNIMVYAKPISEKLMSKMWQINLAKSFDDLKNIFMGDSSKKRNSLNLNLITSHNTLEFRFPNMTNEEVIWQNNINVLSKLILLAKNIPEEFLDSKLKEFEYLTYTFNSHKEYIARYHNICFRDSLLFADLVFDNTLDKMYFLKQYLKNYQTTNDKNLVLARKFTI